MRGPSRHSRSRSRHRAVTDLGQANGDETVNEDTTAKQLLRRRAEAAASGVDTNHLSPTFVPLPRSPQSPSSPESKDKEARLSLPGTNVTLDLPAATRPKADGVAFPFKLGRSLMSDGGNASTLTLKSETVGTPKLEAGEEKILGANGTTDVDTTAKLERLDAVRTETATDGKERPGIERFDTAQEAM